MAVEKQSKQSENFNNRGLAERLKKLNSKRFFCATVVPPVIWEWIYFFIYLIFL